MSARWTVNATSGSIDRLLDAPVPIHLSDGTLVFGYTSGAGVPTIAYSSDHVTINTIDTPAVAYGVMGSSGLGIGYPAFSVTRDSSDNLYVIGSVSGTGHLVVIPYAKGAGYTWTPGSAVDLNATVGQTGCSALSATWCNTGGGLNAKGHIFAVFAAGPNVSAFYVIIDAGKALNSNSTAATAGGAYASAPSNSAGSAANTVSSDGYGATNGLSVCVGATAGSWLGTIGSWSVSNTGILTTAAITSNVAIAAANTGGARVLRVASNVWAILYSSPVVSPGPEVMYCSRYSSTAQLTAPVASTTPANWGIGSVPYAGEPASWDATYDAGSNKVWQYSWSTATATTLLRLGISIGSGVVWDAATTTDNTGVGTGTNGSFHIVSQPITPTFVDWMTFNTNGGTYALLGSYSSYQAPPYAPTLTTPANGGTVDLASGTPFAWVFNPLVGGNTQTNWAMRRKIGGGAYSYWNLGTLTWQGTIVWNSGTSGMYTFAAGNWTNGNTYSWSVATQDQGGQGPFASDFAVIAANAPVTTVTAPSGTVIQAQPTVTWSTTFGSGLSQTNYRVIVYNSTQYTGGGFTPGTTVGDFDTNVVADALALSRQVSIPLLNGTLYRAYVQITATGGLVSAWAFSAFTVSISSPATPSLQATYDSVNDRVQLTVQAYDNLLTSDQASIETSTTGLMAVSNCAIARTTARALDGLASLTLTSSAGGNMSAGTPTGLSGVAVMPNTTHEGLVSVSTASNRCNVNVSIIWYTSAGAVISTTAGTSIFETTSPGWVQAACNGVSPANAAYAAILVTVLGTAGASEVHYIDRLSLAPGSLTLWTRGGLSGLTNALFQQSDDGGVTWASVRNGVNISLSFPYQVVTVYDNDAHSGRNYRVYTLANV